MATICKECGGVIPDIIFNGKISDGCKNHTKRIVNIPRPKVYG